mmetsp:Transcript_23172/g.51586  ORF Transcript_23172/g.51586 Transcript_23172/m.51586 type:complete len:253 (-) Transcript_23172:697-1455(-)
MKMNQKITLEGNSSSGGELQSRPQIYVASGCVLFPVFVVVWYHYTKRHCRKFVVGFLKNEPENKSDCYTRGLSERSFERMEEDDYNHHQQQRDDVNNYSSTVLTDRFVKWVNRSNVFSSRSDKFQLDTRTKENLFGNCSMNPKKATKTAPTVGNNTGAAPETTNKTTSMHCHRESQQDEHDDASSLFWECIPNMEQSQWELCSMDIILQSEDDEDHQTNLGASTVVSVQYDDGNGNDNDNGNGNNIELKVGV